MEKEKLPVDEDQLDADEIETPESKNLKRYGYRSADNTLIIEFKNGARYEYPDVPRELFDQMRHADSAGSFFAQRVKNDFQAKRLEKQNARA